MARASGIEMDLRTQGYGLMINWILSRLPMGEGTVMPEPKSGSGKCSSPLISSGSALHHTRWRDKNKSDGKSQGRAFHPFGAAERRGPLLCKSKRYKIPGQGQVRTPTFANIPALLETLKNCSLADVPILILTIDPCISCTER